MQFTDYSPPSSPSPDQQQDALQKGLGRALQWALGRCLDEAQLLHACLHDLRFDASVEGPRGDWLWEMIEAVGARERFRGPVLRALSDLAEDSAYQLCQLALCYAEGGDELFRTRLYEIVEQKPIADSPSLGEEEIITLDGDLAFLFAAKVRGRSLASRAWEWHDRTLAYLAIEHFGEDQVRKLLEASSDEAIKRFRDCWQEDELKQTEQGQPVSHRERMLATPVAEILQVAAGNPQCFWLRGWGMHAGVGDLQTVAHSLWAAQEPAIIINLLRVFSARALPEFDARLIELCQHADEEVRQRALAALSQNAHALVREFAVSELQQGLRDGRVVSLFINNYRQGDEERIMEALEHPGDECEFHWLLMEARKVLEKNPQADGSRLGIIAYALTPCESCRYCAAQVLLNKQVVPEWLREECRHDSCEDCRVLAVTATGSPGPDSEE
jgi:hypothetical protein